jgi:hypothetical protein
LWVSADYETRVKLQYLVYPDGIYFDGKTDNYRTSRVNAIFRLIASLSGSSPLNKNGKHSKILEVSRQVEVAGVISNLKADMKALQSALAWLPQSQPHTIAQHVQ